MTEKTPTFEDWIEYEAKKQEQGLKDILLKPILQEEFNKKIKFVIENMKNI